MYKLKKEFSISCSHRLFNDYISKHENEHFFGKCNNEPSHGHNYKIILKLKSEELNFSTGMIENFYHIKKVFKDVIDDVYDHKYLNTCPGFEHVIPTAENMSKIFFDLLKREIYSLYSVEIYETDGASAEYEEED